VGETLLRYQRPVLAEHGAAYEARACGAPTDSGTWEGWIEFVPADGGAAVRSPRETTQPNRTDLEYWATGLTAVYLEGALRRALDIPLHAAPASASRPSVFPGPAPRPGGTTAGAESVLDPFSVYQKGEALLRRQLAALSPWHLVNIITAYALSDDDAAALSRRSAAELIETIVMGVRADRGAAARRR
jgi:hypothetical protein